MERKVIFRDRQENTPDDMNNLQSFVQSSIDHLVRYGISQGRHYAGFSVAKSGPSEVTVGAGFYFNDGKAYIRLNELTQDLYGSLPVLTRRKVTLVVSGLTQEVDPQSRDFLIDVDNDTIEPSVVSMEEQRSAQLAFVPGLESANPLNPTIDATTLAVAHILLDPNGVVSIEPVTGNVVPSVQKNVQLLTELINWKALISQGVESLRSDVANLAARIPPNLADLLVDMVNRVKELEAEVRTPAAAAWSFVERFVNLGDSDSDHEDYDAIVDGGLRFPGNAATIAPITLLNPLEPKVKTVEDITLPAWTDAVRLSTGSTDGELSINQYSVVSEETVRKTLTRDVVTYSQDQVAAGSCSWLSIAMYRAARWWDNAQIELVDYAELEQRRRQSPDPIKLTLKHAAEAFANNTWLQWFARDGTPQRRTMERACTVETITEPYWEVVTVEETINGSGIGQTILAPANGWVTHVSVPFTQVAATGDVQFLVTETTNGKPDITRVLGRGSVVVGDLSVDGKVKVPVTPHFWKAGVLYGIVLMTTGNHFVGTVGDGGLYSQGDLYYLTDTHAWAPVQVDADLAVDVHYAKFSSTRVEVQMENIEQAGGITALRLMAAMFVPEGTQLIFEIQNAGVWRPVLPGEDAILAGSPVTCQFRAVFIGTYDLMPAIDLTQAETEASRTQLAFAHVSEAHEPAAAVEDVQVDVFLRGFDADHHSLDCELLIGGIPEAADSVSDWSDPSDPNKMRRTFTFNLGAPAAAYAIKLDGTTDEEGTYFAVAERWDSAT